jgi:ribosome-associated protein
LDLSAKELALEAASLLSEKKAVDIILLEMGQITLIADYFLICSGASKIQTRALSDHLKETLSAKGRSPLRLEGYQEGNWILQDYGELVVHVFLNEERSFYKLERLWGKAESVDLQYLESH